MRSSRRRAPPRCPTSRHSSSRSGTSSCCSAATAFGVSRMPRHAAAQRSANEGKRGLHTYMRGTVLFSCKGGGHFAKGLTLRIASHISVQAWSRQLQGKRACCHAACRRVRAAGRCRHRVQAAAGEAGAPGHSLRRYWRLAGLKSACLNASASMRRSYLPCSVQAMLQGTCSAVQRRRSNAQPLQPLQGPPAELHQPLCALDVLWCV